MHTAALCVVGMVVSRGLDGTRDKYQRYRRFQGAAAYKHFKVPPSDESCLPAPRGGRSRDAFQLPCCLFFLSKFVENANGSVVIAQAA